MNEEYEKIASRYLFTDMAITNLQLDRNHLEHSPCKIKEPYFKLLDQLISTAIQERKQLKRLMYQHNIQVEHINSDRLFSTYKYYLNGYVHEVSFLILSSKNTSLASCTSFSLKLPPSIELLINKESASIS